MNLTSEEAVMNKVYRLRDRSLEKRNQEPGSGPSLYNEMLQDEMSNSPPSVLKPEKPRKKFSLTPRSQLKIQSPDWLVKGVFEHNTLAAIIGESGVGKSFVGIDLACCVATGLPWHGRQTKQGTVVYFAGEGGNGLSLRITVWEQHHGVREAPLWVSLEAIDLSDSDNMLPIVKNELGQLDTPPSLIIIDTLAKHYSGEENSAKEMGLFIKNLESLRQEFNITVIVIHHSGKDPSKGARGSSAFRAALDHELLVAKPDKGFLKISCEKARNSEPFTPMSFKFKNIHLVGNDGNPITDEEGELIQSCVLELLGDVKQTKNLELTLQQQTAKDLFEELLHQDDSGLVYRTKFYKALEMAGITHPESKHRVKKKLADVGVFSIHEEKTQNEYFIPLSENPLVDPTLVHHITSHHTP